jgi:hypothetical protein
MEERLHDETMSRIMDAFPKGRVVNGVELDWDCWIFYIYPGDQTESVETSNGKTMVHTTQEKLIDKMKLIYSDQNDLFLKNIRVNRCNHQYDTRYGAYQPYEVWIYCKSLDLDKEMAGYAEILKY